MAGKKRTVEGVGLAATGAADAPSLRLSPKGRASPNPTPAPPSVAPEGHQAGSGFMLMESLDIHPLEFAGNLLLRCQGKLFRGRCPAGSTVL